MFFIKCSFHFLDREYPFWVTLTRREEFEGFGIDMYKAVNIISNIAPGMAIFDL